MFIINCPRNINMLNLNFKVFSHLLAAKENVNTGMFIAFVLLKWNLNYLRNEPDNHSMQKMLYIRGILM